MKGEKVARPDVLSYEQGRQDERKKLITEIQAGAVSVAGLIEKARQEVAREIVEEIEEYFNDRDKRSVLILQSYPASAWWESLKSRFLKDKSL